MRTVIESGVVPVFGAAYSQEIAPAFCAVTWKLSGVTPSVLPTEICRWMTWQET